MTQYVGVLPRMVSIRQSFLHWISGALKVAHTVQGLPQWKWIRLGILLVVDISIMVAAYYSSFVLRLDDVFIQGFEHVFQATLPYFVAIHLGVFVIGGMYRQVWRYANPKNALLIGRLLVVGTVLCYAVIYSLFSPQMILPRSVFLIALALSLIAQIAAKFSWRGFIYLKKSMGVPDKERCLIYGAGVSGESLVRQMMSTHSFDYQPVGFIDDDPGKRGRIINGLKILGSGADLEEIARVNRVNVILITLHAAPGKVLRTIVQTCQQAELAPLIVPDLARSLAEDLPRPRPVDIKDLLKRSPKSINRNETCGFFRNKSVLVTGAGGSIGSEIARQVLAAGPSKLVLVDACEFNLYNLEQELSASTDDHVLVPSLGSVTDSAHLDEIFAKYRPECVLHAAAYKHVPLVEANVVSSIKNNVVGTRMVAEAAIKYGVRNFVLISSDKAVRPTNVMGMTKRVCEILVQAMHKKFGHGCKFSAVRFGNVLGSSGSVIPRFLAQIEQGGPVTVTDKRMTRYFMLISEAVGLVLQSVVKTKGGEVFVLDMGEPVNIYDMAEQLITLAGKKPFVDIEINITGVRPGEKLFEELIIEDAERHEIHEDIFIAHPEHFAYEDALRAVDNLVELANEGEEQAAKTILADLASNRLHREDWGDSNDQRMGATSMNSEPVGEAG